MQQNDKPILIYATFPTPAEAERVGGELVDAGLAACVNIIPGMTAIYNWEGQRHRDSECVMIIKTRQQLAAEAVRKARALHSYTNPALLVIPVEGGSESFLSWIMEQTSRPAT